jgi:ABC-type uncharacterized transport system substrate-binding protein
LGWRRRKSDTDFRERVGCPTARRDPGARNSGDCGAATGNPYVDKILRGAKPADLPVQVPVKFEMAVNVKTAKVLGLTVPPSILLRADEAVE